MPGAALARWVGLAVVLLASVAAAASERADFRLVDAAGHPYSLASFPPDSVLAIYFGYSRHHSRLQRELGGGKKPGMP